MNIFSARKRWDILRTTFRIFQSSGRVMKQTIRRADKEGPGGD